MKMLLFDVDGTLVSTGGAGVRALSRVFHKLYGWEDPLGSISCAGKTDPAILREVFRKFTRKDPRPREIETVRKLYIASLPGEIERSAGFRVLPGVAELLRIFEEREGLLLGLTTGNFEEGARIKLSRGGIRHHFPFGGFGSDSEERLELTRIAIERGRARAGRPIAPRDVIVIGDTPEDIRCGKGAGAVTVAVATGFVPMEELEAREPDYLFRDFSSPQRLLAILDR